MGIDSGISGEKPGKISPTWLDEKCNKCKRQGGVSRLLAHATSEEANQPNKSKRRYPLPKQWRRRGSSGVAPQIVTERSLDVNRMSDLPIYTKLSETVESLSGLCLSWEEEVRKRWDGGLGWIGRDLKRESWLTRQSQHSSLHTRATIHLRNFHPSAKKSFLQLLIGRNILIVVMTL